jgi:hypothetical protein
MHESILRRLADCGARFGLVLRVEKVVRLAGCARAPPDIAPAPRTGKLPTRREKSTHGDHRSAGVPPSWAAEPRSDPAIEAAERIVHRSHHRRGHRDPGHQHHDNLSPGRSVAPSDRPRRQRRHRSPGYAAAPPTPLRPPAPLRPPQGPPRQSLVAGLVRATRRGPVRRAARYDEAAKVHRRHPVETADAAAETRQSDEDWPASTGRGRDGPDQGRDRNGSPPGAAA